MDRNHVIAWACGIFAALLIIMAGKSCMKIPENSGKKNATETTTLNDFERTLGTGIVKVTEGREEIVYDEFGRPIKTTKPASEAEAQIYTDKFGNSIEPPTEIFTDEFGNIIEAPADEYTEPSPQYVTDVFGNTIDETVPPVTQSDEDSAEEATGDTATLPPGFSGYDHGKYDDEGNLIPTIPPDFKIVIE